MKKIVFLLLPLFLFSTSLQTLLKQVQNSNLSKAKSYEVLSNALKLQSAKKAPLPKVLLNLNAQNLNPKSPFTPGTIYSASIILNYTIFDGGKKRAQITQKRFLLASSTFERSFFVKNLKLQVIKLFFDIKTLDALKKVYLEKERLLSKKLAQLKKLYQNGLSTKDNLLSLQAALQENRFNLQNIAYQKKSLLFALKTLLNQKISHLGKGYLLKQNVAFKPNKEVLALKAKALALFATAKGINAAKMPQVTLQASISKFAYNRSDLLHPKGINSQSKIALNASYLLLDNNEITFKSQASKAKAMALMIQAKQKLIEQKNNFLLAKEKIALIRNKIKTQKVRLKSTKALLNSQSQKFNSGLVDYVSYLEALTNYTLAKAKLQKAYNELEIAYALYYFYSGKKLERFVK